jgi:uncharacterized protein (TIGR03435 family)
MYRIALRSAAFLAIAILFVHGFALHAQAPIMEEPGYTPTLTFDVISMRPSPPPDAHFHVSVSSAPHSSRFEATNLPVKALIQIAYGFDMPVTGAPDWVNSTLYDIQARSDEDTDARLAKLTSNEVRLEKRHAIRALLTDRLGLTTHLESRNSAIYNLTVVKDGTKMKIVPPPAAGEAPAQPPPADVQAHGSEKGLEFIGTNEPMRGICGVLNSQVEAPVVDKTGLTGLYNFTLQFGRDWSEANPDSYPSIFTAVQEQLGLKLEAVHETVPNLIIDHITKPTQN